MDVWRNWHKGQHPFTWDTANYYSYLPAYLLNEGSFEFKNASFNDNYLPICPVDNKHIPKTTYGMALMYSPFFALGYKVAINQNDPRDGFSEPFATVIHWGMIGYAIISLFLLRILLRKYYSELVTAITITVIFLGTSLFYYSVSMPEMTHSVLFLLYVAFLLATKYWYERRKFTHAMLIGFLLGLISLIRPTDIIVVLFFMFWPSPNVISVNDRVRFWIMNWKSVLIVLVSAFLVWLPQLLFWKSRTGQLLYFSYGEERFFWNDPQLLNVLFSYRKGLFVYTPLILISLIGLFFMKEDLKKIRNIILIVFATTTYVICCWWDWFFGGAFAARAFVQHFSYLSIPLAAIINYLFVTHKGFLKTKILGICFVFICAFGISLNLLNTYQYTNNIIHFHSMSRKTYWMVFGKASLSEEERAQWWQSLDIPDYDKLKKGDRD